MDILRTEFTKLDNKKSGSVSVDNFRDVLSKFGVNNGLNTVTKKFSHDGNVKYNEFLNYFQQSRRDKQYQPTSHTDLKYVPLVTKKVREHEPVPTQRQIYKKQPEEQAVTRERLYRFRDTLAKNFKKYDKTNAGTISKEQFQEGTCEFDYSNNQALHDCGFNQPSSVNSLVQTMTTPNGNVDYDHFLALVQPYSGLQTETAEKKHVKVHHVELPEQYTHLKEKRAHNEHHEWANDVSKQSVGRYNQIYETFRTADPLNTGRINEDQFVNALHQLHIANDSNMTKIINENKLDSGKIDYHKFVKILIDEGRAKPVANDTHLQPGPLTGIHLDDIARIRHVKDSDGITKQEKFFDQTKIFDDHQTAKEKLSVSGNRMGVVPGHAFNDSSSVTDTFKHQVAPASTNIDYKSPTFESKIFSHEAAPVPHGKRQNFFKGASSTLNPLLNNEYVRDEIEMQHLRGKARATAGDLVSYFHHVDSDHSGRVTHDQFKKGIQQLGFPLTDKQFSHVVKLFDKHGEGTINYNTFIDKISRYENDKKYTTLADTEAFQKRSGKKYFAEEKLETPQRIYNRDRPDQQPSDNNVLTVDYRSTEKEPLEPTQNKQRPVTQVKNALRKHMNDEGVKNLLNKLDEEGSVPFSEFRETLRTIGADIPDQDFAGVANYYDTNRNGKLTYRRFNEMLNAADPLEKPFAETHHMSNIVGQTVEIPKEQRKGLRVIANETFGTSKDSTLLTETQRAKLEQQANGKREDDVEVYSLQEGLSDRFRRHAHSLRHMFRKLDTSKTGQITPDELQRGLAGIGVNLDQGQVDRIVSKVSNQGKINFDSFAKFFEPNEEEIQRRRRDAKSKLIDSRSPATPATPVSPITPIYETPRVPTPPSPPRTEQVRISTPVENSRTPIDYEEYQAEPYEPPAPTHQPVRQPERRVDTDDSLLRSAIAEKANLTGTLRGMFLKFDADHDGSISKQDFKTGLRNIGIELSDRDMTRVVDKLRGENENIDYVKFCDYITTKITTKSNVGKHRELVRDVVENVDSRQLDHDNQAFVNRRVRAELDEASQGKSIKLREAFRAVDRNNTKELDEKSFKFAINSIGHDVPEWVVDRATRMAETDGKYNYEKFLRDAGFDMPQDELFYSRVGNSWRQENEKSGPIVPMKASRVGRYANTPTDSGDIIGHSSQVRSKSIDVRRTRDVHGGNGNILAHNDGELSGVFDTYRAPRSSPRSTSHEAFSSPVRVTTRTTSPVLRNPILPDNEAKLFTTKRRILDPHAGGSELKLFSEKGKVENRQSSHLSNEIALAPSMSMYTPPRGKRHSEHDHHKGTGDYIFKVGEAPQESRGVKRFNAAKTFNNTVNVHNHEQKKSPAKRGKGAPREDIKDLLKHKIYLNYNKTKEAFRKLDRDNDGVLSIQDIQTGLKDMNIVASKNDLRQVLPNKSHITYKDFSDAFAPDATNAEKPYIAGEKEQRNDFLNRSIGKNAGTTHSTFKSSIGFAFKPDEGNRPKSAPARGQSPIVRGHGDIISWRW